MPVYNCAKYIREAIESILNQTYKEFEFIIINDGSTDNTTKILNEYANKDSRIKVINRPNSGIVVALNRGLAEAKGEWIFRMDGDDIALPHRFAVQIETIKKNPSLVLLGGWCQQINAGGIPLKINKYPTKHNALVKRLEARRPFFPHPTACFSRDMVIRLGGYRERFRHAEDTDLWLRLAGKGGVACCEDVVIQLRKHSHNISYLQNNLQQLRSVASRICYFRRKAGLSDPSQMEEDVWQDFLKWVEKRMDEEGFFQIAQGWQELRNALYSSPTANKFKKGALLMKEVINNPLARKALWGRIGKENLAMKLAEESRRFL
jgi:glycosyltransferase involved in cell wall biosynthesis